MFRLKQGFLPILFSLRQESFASYLFYRNLKSQLHFSDVYDKRRKNTSKFFPNLFNLTNHCRRLQTNGFCQPNV